MTIVRFNGFIVSQTKENRTEQEIPNVSFDFMSVSNYGHTYAYNYNHVYN